MMNAKLHIDNLSVTATETDLRDLFSACGKVVEVNISTSPATGRPRGFGFVTMATPEGARAAIRTLNGRTTAAGSLTVSEAWPDEQREASSSGH